MLIWNWTERSHFSPSVCPAGIDLIAAFYGSLYAGCVPITVRPPHPQNISTTLPTVKMIVEVRQFTALSFFPWTFMSSFVHFTDISAQVSVSDAENRSKKLKIALLLLWCNSNLEILPISICRSVTRPVWWPRRSSVSCCALRRPRPLWTSGTGLLSSTRVQQLLQHTHTETSSP